jgi:hypothetical protein
METIRRYMTILTEALSEVRPLHDHEKIALDFDGTLIQSRNAAALRGFVARHWRDKGFWIVTHRSHGLVEQIPRELAAARPNPLSPTMFRGIISVGNEAWEAWAADDQRRRAGDLTGPHTPAEKSYVEFKAEQCVKIGATVLVDDKPLLCQAACERRGVQFMHIDEFLDAEGEPT